MTLEDEAKLEVIEWQSVLCDVMDAPICADLAIIAAIEALAAVTGSQIAWNVPGGARGVNPVDSNPGGASRPGGPLTKPGAAKLTVAASCNFAFSRSNNARCCSKFACRRRAFS